MSAAPNSHATVLNATTTVRFASIMLDAIRRDIRSQSAPARLFSPEFRRHGIPTIAKTGCKRHGTAVNYSRLQNSGDSVFL
jgi:hypothetical protein